MRQTRNTFLIALLCISVLSALWGVCAQDKGGFRSPAPIVPPEDPNVLAPPPTLKEPSASTPQNVSSTLKKTAIPLAAPVLSGQPDVIVTRGASDIEGLPAVKQADVKPVHEEMPPPLPPPTIAAPIELSPPPIPVAEPKPNQNKAAEPALPALVPFPAVPSVKDELPALPVPTIPAPMETPPAVRPTIKMPEASLPALDPVKDVIKEPVLAPVQGGAKVMTPPTISIPAAPPEPEPGLVPPPEVKPAPSTEPARPRPFVLVRPKAVESLVPTAEIVPPRASVPAIPSTATPTTPPAPNWPEPRVPEAPLSEASTARESRTALVGVQVPQVLVEKRGRTAPRPGEPALFQIVVKNTGTSPGQQIRVEDDLPKGAHVVSAEPQPLLENGRLVWTLPAVAAGAERVLSFTLQAPATVTWFHRTTVSVSATTVAQTALSPAPPVSGLAIRVAAPTSVAVGAPAVFDVTFTNQTRAPLNGPLLQAALSPGLRHAMGQNIEAEIGNIEPAASRTIKVQATALQAGRQQLNVRLATLAGMEASGSASVEVGSQGAGSLSVQQPALPRVYVGRESELRLVVTNTSGVPLRDIIVIDTLPEGVEYAGSSDRGIHQPINRTVHWVLEQLGPGQMQVLLLRVQGKAAGPFSNEVVVRAGGTVETKSTATLSVESVSDLSLAILGDDALEQGREAVYEVRLANTGSGGVTGVKVQVDLADGLVPRNAQGPVRHRIDGQTVTFEGLPALDSQGQAVYRILALGQTAGDRRVRVSVASEQAPTPLVREKRTHVYRD